MRWGRFFLFNFVMATLLDLYTTHIGISIDIYNEINPAARYLIMHQGFALFSIIAVLLCFVLYWALERMLNDMKDTRPKFAYGLYYTVWIGLLALKIVVLISNMIEVL